MKTIELSKMGLNPLTDPEIQKIEGGGLWDLYEKVGYAIGIVVGTALRITNDVAKKLLEHAVIK